MPRGMIVARWDDRFGVTREGAFPPEVADLLEHDDLLTIFSTHALTEKPGILAMRIKRLNIVSYYSGLPEGEDTDQFFVVVILDPDEDPNSYEERLTEIAKLIISSVGKPGFEELFAGFYDQLIKMEKITEEQRYAFIFRDKVRHLLLQKLTNGPMTKEGLAKWLSKEIDQEVTDIDSLLAPLKKTDLVEEVNISKGKKVSLDYVFLIRDVAVIRVPNVEIFKAAKEGKMAADIREKYIEEVEKFFKQYRISNADAQILGEVISNPDTYEIIQVLRNEYCTRAELPLKLGREIANLDKVLKYLAENKIITAIKDKKGRVWVLLLSDIKFPNFFPEYMIDVIRRRWKEGTIAKEIALKHLELLRAEYIATEAPKFRRKMLKAIQSFFENAENLISKGQYDQAATIFDNMAGQARDMGERAFAELLDEIAKQLREDKEQYVESKFPEDRVKVIEMLNEIIEKDKEKEAKKKGVVPKEEKKKKKKGKEEEVAVETPPEAPKKKKKKGKAEYKEVEEIAETPEPPVSAEVTETVPDNNPVEQQPVTEEEEGISLEKLMEAVERAEPKELKQMKKELQGLIKQAKKSKDIQTAAQYMEVLAKVEEKLGNVKEARNIIEEQNEMIVKALIETRNTAEKEAKSAVKKGDYQKAYELYEKCREISDSLFKSGIMNEADNAKKYASLAAQMKEKIGAE